MQDNTVSNIRLNQVWATPIWEIDTRMTPQFNAALLEAFQRIKPSATGLTFNLFEHKNEPAIVMLEKVALEAAAKAFKQAGYARRVLGMRTGSVNTMKPGGWDTPHTHPHVMLAGVYYVKVPKGSGQLWLLDPRSEGTLWDSRVGMQVEPVEGKLVLFPGGVQHFVTQNNADDIRVSVALNFTCTMGAAPE